MPNDAARVSKDGGGRGTAGGSPVENPRRSPNIRNGAARQFEDTPAPHVIVIASDCDSPHESPRFFQYHAI